MSDTNQSNPGMESLVHETEGRTICRHHCLWEEQNMKVVSLSKRLSNLREALVDILNAPPTDAAAMIAIATAALNGDIDE